MIFNPAYLPVGGRCVIRMESRVFIGVLDSIKDARFSSFSSQENSSEVLISIRQSTMRMNTLLSLVTFLAALRGAKAATTLLFCTQPNFGGTCQEVDVPDEACFTVPTSVGSNVRSINFVGATADCFICE